MSVATANVKTPPAPKEPTEFDKLRSIPWSLGYDLANTFFVQLTFFGSVFVLFLNDLGLDKSQIGYLLSAFPLLSLLSLFITLPVARLGYKKIFLVSLGMRNLFTSGLLLVPLVLRYLGVANIVIYIAALTVAFAVSRAVAMTALLPWQQEYIPNQIRGKYSAYSSIIISVTGLIAVGIAGYLMDRPLGGWRYSILFAIGIGFGLLSIYLSSHWPGGAAAKTTLPLLQAQRKVFVPLRDRRFFLYLVVLGLNALTMGPIFSFIPIFMQEKVGLSTGNIVFLQTGSLVGSLLSSYFWGWLADRYGSKPIALSGLLLTLTLPVWWYLMPRGSPLSLPLALSISFFQGIAGSSWGIGSGRLLFVSIVPAEYRTEYLSHYNAWMGLLGGAGSILSGQLLQTFAGLDENVFGLSLDAYAVLFGIGLCASLICIVLLQTLPDSHETKMGEFAGLFFHGNPLSAISSVIRFYYAKEEAEVLAVTERLGQTRSPLTEDQLIASLNDPRFYVRFEAIVSITRHSSSDRLVNALIEVLEERDPALSVIAAWALGRIGNVRAISALRRAFQNSQFRSVQAHAARALGSLGDTESVPAFLEYVQNKNDMGVKAACSSALGKLGVTEATPALLQILYIDSYPSSRKEMGLALARLVGAESNYIRLMRQLNENTGTVMAQEMGALMQALKPTLTEKENISSYLLLAREQFAAGALDLGLQSMLNAGALFAREQSHEHCQFILAECLARMREFGWERPEYLIVLIVTLENC